MATDAKSLYAISLRNTHALESQGLQQMESQVKGLGTTPSTSACCGTTSRSRAGSSGASKKRSARWARARRPSKRR